MTPIPRDFAVGDVHGRDVALAPPLIASFVHLAAAKHLPHLRRVGVRASRTGLPEPSRGVFLTPRTPDFFLTHQWVRELRRKEVGPLGALDVRLPDDEPVWLGHYGGGHRLMTAAEACGTFAGTNDPLGWEVVLPRRVAAKEVRRTRMVPQGVGWRVFPKAKGVRRCGCEFCTRGQRGARRLRELRRRADGA